MSHLSDLEEPYTLTLKDGDWDIIMGLLAVEHSIIAADPNRQPYAKTLWRIRQQVIWEKKHARKDTQTALLFNQEGL